MIIVTLLLSIEVLCFVLKEKESTTINGGFGE